MEITAITGYLGIRPRTSAQSAEKITARVFENRDSDGDNQLSVQELRNSSRLLAKVDANGDNFVNQEELFAGLTKRLEEKSGFSFEVSLNINVIKANLGDLLTSVLNRSDSGSLSNLLTTQGVSTDTSQVNTNANERYIKALITAGIDDGGFIGGTGGLTSNSELRNAISPLSTTQNDGRQLLLNLLTSELGTPEEDALAILSVLQSQSFQTVA
jgi:hypothetical protein